MFIFNTLLVEAEEPGHFKKHWKKYVAGAAGAAAVGAGVKLHSDYNEIQKDNGEFKYSTSVPGTDLFNKVKDSKNIKDLPTHNDIINRVADDGKKYLDRIDKRADEGNWIAKGFRVSGGIDERRAVNEDFRKKNLDKE